MLFRGFVRRVTDHEDLRGSQPSGDERVGVILLSRFESTPGHSSEPSEANPPGLHLWHRGVLGDSLFWSEHTAETSYKVQQ